MDNRIQYIGIDVDDKRFHGYSICEDQNKGIAFITKPSIGHLVKKLKEIHQKGYVLKSCYEATYLGYSLQRDLSKHGYLCEIIAPSLIPQERSRKVKTDRIDAEKLARYYKNNLLTIVHVPDEEEEIIRDLIRSRKFVLKQLKSLKLHVLFQCRRIGLNYKQATHKPKASYWTGVHYMWLEKTMNQCASKVLQSNIFLLLRQIRMLEQQVDLYNNEIEKVAEEALYRQKVYALNCYRGIDTLSAMTLITEIGDIHRFKHPSKLTSYSGMDLIEYSSGGKERRFNMSKMGNKNIRTTVIEASQTVLKIPYISKPLKRRRKKASAEAIEIADRCMYRLHKKAKRLYCASKPINKIKAACAREMLGFIWESLRLVS